MTRSTSAAAVLGEGYRIIGYQPCAQTTPTAAAATTSPTTPARLLPSYPPGFASVLAAAIARRDATVCALFSQSGAQQFASVVGASSCPDGVGVLAAKVSDPARYAGMPTPAGSPPGPLPRAAALWMPAR